MTRNFSITTKATTIKKDDERKTEEITVVKASVDDEKNVKLAIEIWDRLDICKECPRGSLPVGGYPTKCDECGCLIQVKAMFPIFHCPIGKW